MILRDPPWFFVDFLCQEEIAWNNEVPPYRHNSVKTNIYPNFRLTTMIFDPNTAKASVFWFYQTPQKMIATPPITAENSAMSTSWELVLYESHDQLK